MSGDQLTIDTPPQGRYGLLAGALVVLAAMYPLLGQGGWGHFIWTAVFWFVLLGCLRVVTAHAGVRRVARALGWVAIAASIASLWCFNTSDGGHGPIYLVIRGLSLAFLLATTGITLWDVFGHSRVRGQTLIGAACGYVLLGLTFAFLMLVLHSIGTEPVIRFDGSTGTSPGAGEMARYLYFSFVTLSTLGYGDVVPSTPAAQVLAPAEAILGQLYLAVFIARLIGMHVAAGRPCPRCEGIERRDQKPTRMNATRDIPLRGIDLARHVPPDNDHGDER